MSPDHLDQCIQHHEKQQAQGEVHDTRVDELLKDMTVDEIEDSFDSVTDCLANIWITWEKDPAKRNRLIIQQLESALLNDCERTAKYEESR